MPRYQFSGESDYKRHAQEGARTIDEETQESFRQQELAHQQRMEALAAQRALRVQQLEEAHERVLDSIATRKAAEAKALADKRRDAEDRIPKALGDITNIDPSSPKARQALSDIQARYWQLVGHGRTDFPSLDKHIDEKRKEVEQYEKSHPDQTAKNAALAAKQAAFENDLKNPPLGTTAKGGTTPSGVHVENKEALQAKAAQKAKDEAARNEVLHEKRLEYIGGRMAAMEKANPTLFNSTGLYTDKTGQQRFGYKDKESDDSATIATPEQIRQWNAYQGLQATFDKHTKALDDLRQAQLDMADGKLPENAVGGQISNSEFEKKEGAAGNAAKNTVQSDAENEENIATGTPPPPPSGAETPPANPSTGAPVIPPATNPEAAPTPDQADVAPPPVADVTGGPAKVVPGPTPHPMEGQTVRHKASGQMGKIINGQFVPD